MADNFNTIAGWTLFGGIIALGSGLLVGEAFKHHKVKGGYEVVSMEPKPATEAVIELTNFSAGDPVKGAEVFKKCSSCHNVAQGGANGTGPNLYGILGKKHGHAAGFAYSEGMLAKPGNWDFANLDEWLTSPKKYVAGTKMSFAGLSKASDRADVIVYLNSQGSNLPIPAAPAAPAAAPAAEGAVPAAAAPPAIKS
jgi:cytochrome c